MANHNVSFYEANKIFPIKYLLNNDDVSRYPRIFRNNFTHPSHNDDTDPECLTSRPNSDVPKRVKCQIEQKL